MTLKIIILKCEFTLKVTASEEKVQIFFILTLFQ